jgi:hypothetical protein
MIELRWTMRAVDARSEKRSTAPASEEREKKEKKEERLE